MGLNKVVEVSKKFGFLIEVFWRCFCMEDVLFEDLMVVNRDYIEVFVNVSKEFLRRFKGYDIVVFWSGGKDFMVVFILVKEVFGEVNVVYVRMEYEMLEMEEYIEKFVGKLGVNFIRVDVLMFIEKFGMLIYRNCWCIKMKVEVLYNVVSEFENLFLVVGDCDGESVRRCLKLFVVERKIDFG